MAVLGIIADDFTGATDIAGMLVKGGMRTIQTIGVPTTGTIPDDVDAVVVALKTRSIAAGEAIHQSLDALGALRAAGCVRFFFKYCSTFDSTDAGNIGPVGDALIEALDTRQAIYCPAFPENGRTIFFGHLFVGDLLLSDTHMRHHPLNPMTDASLVRVLARQTRHKVGLASLKQVQSGSAALRAALDKLAAEGVRHVVVDAVADTDLGIIGEAVGDDLLVSQAIERTMAALAKGLVAAGVGRLVVAGGETSGAVVGALDVAALRIGPEIDPGVPWTASVGTRPLLLALKSGNFGAPDFFNKAFELP
jgi:uncharacterized protein YgbK (DUF1537 family)